MKTIDTSSLDLLGGKIYINETLSPENQKLGFYGRKLKQENLFSKSYAVDGIVLIQSSRNEKPIEVLLFSILEGLYPDFKFKEVNRELFVDALDTMLPY